MKKNIIYLLLFVWACSSVQEELPILGPREAVEKRQPDGSIRQDTVYHQIPDFQLVNQYNDTISNETFSGKIYVADFFFTTCPTICPKMTTHLRQLFKQFEGNEKVAFLSHSIDPRRDSVGRLAAYARDLGVLGQRQWFFVTGEREAIFRIGQEGYFVTAKEDDTAPEGILHSGAFILVDAQQRIRGMYDGTNPEDIPKLAKDIQKLLEEKPAVVEKQ